MLSCFQVLLCRKHDCETQTVDCETKQADCETQNANCETKTAVEFHNHLNKTNRHEQHVKQFEK